MKVEQSFNLKFLTLLGLLGIFFLPPLVSHAGSYFQVDVLGISASKKNTNANSAELFSNLSLEFKPRFGFELNSTGSTNILLGSKMRLFSFKTPSNLTLTGASDMHLDLYTGIEFVQESSSFAFYGGLTGTGIITAPTASSLQIVDTKSPFFGFELKLLPLRGPSHDIGLILNGEYHLSGSNGLAQVSSAIVAGGEFFIDLSFSSVPIAILLRSDYKNFKLNSGTQTEFVFGFGLRLFLMDTGSKNKGQSRFFYEGV